MRIDELVDNFKKKDLRNIKKLYINFDNLVDNYPSSDEYVAIEGEINRFKEMVEKHGEEKLNEYAGYDVVKDIQKQIDEFVSNEENFIEFINNLSSQICEEEEPSKEKIDTYIEKISSNFMKFKDTILMNYRKIKSINNNLSSLDKQENKQEDKQENNTVPYDYQTNNTDNTDNTDNKEQVTRNLRENNAEKVKIVKSEKINERKKIISTLPFMFSFYTNDEKHNIDTSALKEHFKKYKFIFDEHVKKLGYKPKKIGIFSNMYEIEDIKLKKVGNKFFLINE